jgi:hypothetical protein
LDTLVKRLPLLIECDDPDADPRSSSFVAT